MSKATAETSVVPAPQLPEAALPRFVPTGADRGVLRGSLLVFAAEGLAVPAGLAVAALLTRHLSPAEYGVYAIAAAGIAWLEWTVLSLLARSTYKLIAEADDWRPTGSTVLRAHLAAGLLAGLLVFATSSLVARLFGVPSLGPVLRIFAFDVPLFMLAHAHRGVLVGLGRHTARAWTAATRWTLRAALAAIAVALTAPLWGVAALLTLATLGELLVARFHVRPTLSPGQAPVLPMTVLLRYAGPLIVSATCIRLVDRVDLFALRLFGGSMESVGAYGVAQNLALGPGVFGQAFGPAVIAMLSVRWRRGDIHAAQRGARNALRLGVLLLPFALLAAGAAPGLVRTFFGDAYEAAAIPFALLGVGAAGMLVFSLATAILLAADYPRWTMVLSVPALALALLGHALAVPRFGATGAAAVSAGVGIAGAIAAAVVVHRLTGTQLPVNTLVRALASGTVGGVIALLWPQSGLVLFAQLAALSALLAGMMVLAGEFPRAERAKVVMAAARLRKSRR